MLRLLLISLLSFSAQVSFAQSSPRIKITQLERTKTVEGSKAGQIPLSNTSGDLRYAQYVEIDLTPIGFVPTATGNTSNYSEFVTASDSTAWYIDWQGRGYQFPAGSGTDKNGYYGGNLGNGGDQTIPSVTKSTLTNQLSLYRATDDGGGLVPFRIEVAAGNEPDFQSFKNLTDSLVIKRSDQDFEIISTDGLSIWGNKDGTGGDAGVSIYATNAPIVLQADSIMISTVPNSIAGEKTFLQLSPLGAIVKQEGIDSTDLNFDALQTISASGAGPTSYNVDLSSGGGAVTLAEGANMDITRSGNVLTFASSAGGGSQTLSVVSNTTTLSGGGGSMTIAGAGINVASTSGSTITVTGTEVDGLLTNEGSLTVGAGTGSTSIINSNTSGSTGVTITAGTGLTISEIGNVITLTNSSPDVPQTLSVVSNTTTLSGGGGSMTIAGAGINVASTSGSTITVTGNEVDGLITNEGSLTVGAGTGSTSIINSNTSGSTGVTITAGTGLTISETGNVITLTNSSPDVPQTLSVATNTTTLSGGGGSMTIAGAGINVASTSGSTITVTGTEVDGLLTNEGSLTVGAGTGSTSIINSNTSGSTGVTITAGTGLTISETGNVITLTNSATDNNGIYSASNTIFPDCDATLPTGKYMRFNWFGGNQAVEINDLSNYVRLKSKNTQGSITVDNSTLTSTYWNAGFTQYAQSVVDANAAEMDFNNLSVFQCNQYGFQCNSTTTSFQPPSMTTAQRGAIFPAFDGGIVFDTDLDQFFFREGGAWVSYGGAGTLYYQTAKVNGTSLAQEDFLNFVNTSKIEFTGTDVPGSSWTKVEATIPASAITSTELASSSVTSAKIVDGTIDAVDLNQMSATTGQNLAWNGSAWAPTSSTTTTDFTASGTFTVGNAKSIDIICVGAGGGGGSGRKGATSTLRYGGGGGSAGAVSFGSFSISSLGNPASITVTIGAGGTGGASQTTNSTNGNNGSAGGETKLLISGNEFMVADGGNNGLGGTATLGTGGAAADGGDSGSKAGASGTTNTPPTTPQTSRNKCAGSGGAAGGINASNVVGVGGHGGTGFYGVAAGGTGSSTPGTNGTAGAAADAYKITGGGGGGGAPSGSGNAGAGGNGGIGGGGGAGAASLDSTGNSGAGGNGGDGFVRIIAHF